MRVFGLLSLMIGVALVVFFAADQLGMLGNRDSNPQQPINEAETVSSQANLNTIATRLNLYYIENNRYPDTLDELEASSLDVNIFTYQLCSMDKAIIRLGSTTIVLSNGNAVLDPSASCL